MPKCQTFLNGVPAFLPTVISLSIFAVIFIIVLIVYIHNEKKLRKIFYGIMDEQDEEERKQLEAEAMGQYDGEVKIVQSIENINKQQTPKSQSSQVKVLVKRRRATSVKPSCERLITALSVISKSPVPSAIDVKFTITIDRRCLGNQIMEIISTILVNEVARCRNLFPKEKVLPQNEETRIAEIVVSEMKLKLEQLSNNLPWICHGRLMNNPNWVVSGQEALLENPCDLILSMRIAIEQPIAIVLFGYETRPTMQSIETIHKNRSLQVASTPLTTLDAVTPIKRSRISLASSSVPRRLTPEALHPPQPQLIPTAHTPVGKTDKPYTPFNQVKSTLSKKQITNPTPKARSPKRSPTKTLIKPSPKPISSTHPPTPVIMTGVPQTPNLTPRTPVTSIPKGHKKKHKKKHHSGEVISSDDTQKSDFSKRAI